MSYITDNKAAWEEAFDHKLPNWGEDDYKRLLTEKLPFFNKDVAAELQTFNLRNKTIAQFCCNNGRELLSLMQLGAASGYGFDIAENILAQAVRTAQKAGIDNCRFIPGNILDISEEYNDSFDFVMFTIGAITWFKDLDLLLKKAADCLKPDGILYIQDFHPLINMLPLPGEPDFDKDNLNRLVYSYFRTEPWIENNGVGYISGEYQSKTLTSFTHTISDIINATCRAGLKVVRMNEYDYDVGLTDAYDGNGFPLSLTFTAKK